MTAKLFVQAILKFTLGVVLVGLLIFLPAGTWEYPGGWLLMGILFVPMFLAGIVMMRVNPDLLKSRLNAKEKQGEQQLVVKLSGLMFLFGFIVAGLDFRFGWLPMPEAVSIGGAVVFLIAYDCTGRFCGRTPICPAPLRCKRIKRSSIPACTA